MHVFSGKFTMMQVLKSFPGRINSLKPPVFGFCHCFPFGLEESRELRGLIRWVCHVFAESQKSICLLFFSHFPRGKLGKIEENMKISKCFKSRRTSSFCFK